MSVYVFGTLDLICVPQMDDPQGRISPEMLYTKPSYEDFYSPYGYAHPLSGENIPLSFLLDNKRPIKKSAITKAKAVFKYLLIDHKGKAWKITIGYVDDEEVLVESYIDTTSIGWWILIPGENDYNSDCQRLLGFLSTEPNQKEIDTYWLKYYQATSLSRLSIKQIVSKLNMLYPLKEEK